MDPFVWHWPTEVSPSYTLIGTFPPTRHLSFILEGPLQFPHDFRPQGSFGVFFARPRPKLPKVRQESLGRGVRSHRSQ
jgi:hypothetical protein